jgi:K+/H+ antiporter YhaU regulatory subunit KhtT
VNPPATQILQEGELLVVMGSSKALEELSNQ